MRNKTKSWKRRNDEEGGRGGRRKEMTTKPTVVSETAVWGEGAASDGERERYV